MSFLTRRTGLTLLVILPVKLKFFLKAYLGVDGCIHIFLASTLAGGEWSASHPGRLIPGERAPGTYWIGGWVDPRVGLDDVEKRKFMTLPGLELRPSGHPARSQ
jgi:hypothetical protein